MSRSRTENLERVRRIALEALASYPVTVYLFGSSSRGHTHDFSDIDIAVDPRGPLPPGVFARLREALEESSILQSVEVVDLRDADPDFRARVRTEGVIWSDSENV